MSDTIKSFRDLRVWQSARDLCVEIYKVSSKFPSDERFGLTSQIRRASVSIPSNIAEGFGRRSAKEKEQFYRHSLGSLFELDTQLELALALDYTKSEDCEVLRPRIAYCQAMLIKLLQANGANSVNR